MGDPDDTPLELPLDRSGYRWRFFVGGFFGLLALWVVVEPVLIPSSVNQHESEGLALMAALFLFAPISLSFLVSAVGIYRGWPYGPFLRVLPVVVFACLLAALILADCV